MSLLVFVMCIDVLRLTPAFDDFAWETMNTRDHGPAFRTQTLLTMAFSRKEFLKARKANVCVVVS